jgi:Branched-chain amino acid transport protein (AzlD)
VTTAWITIFVLFLGTALSKAAGPLTTGGKAPSGVTLNVTRLVAPAILAALVVYETLSAAGDGITVDARVVGLGAAGVGIAARLPMIVTVLLAAGATALTRAIA